MKEGISVVRLSVCEAYIACEEASADFLPVGVKDATVFVQVTFSLWGHTESISAHHTVNKQSKTFATCRNFYLNVFYRLNYQPAGCSLTT